MHTHPGGGAPRRPCLSQHSLSLCFYLSSSSTPGALSTKEWVAPDWNNLSAFICLGWSLGTGLAGNAKLIGLPTAQGACGSNSGLPYSLPTGATTSSLWRALPGLGLKAGTSTRYMYPGTARACNQLQWGHISPGQLLVGYKTAQGLSFLVWKLGVSTCPTGAGRA